MFNLHSYKSIDIRISIPVFQYYLIIFVNGNILQTLEYYVATILIQKVISRRDFSKEPSYSFYTYIQVRVSDLKLFIRNKYVHIKQKFTNYVGILQRIRRGCQLQQDIAILGVVINREEIITRQDWIRQEEYVTFFVAYI